MATKHTFKTYLCLALDALPCILSFITTFIWVFFTSAPATSVTATWLWLLGIAAATIFSIAYSIYHYHRTSTNRLSWYEIIRIQQSILDLVRSLANSAALLLLELDLVWMCIHGRGSSLKPLGSTGPAGTNNSDWFVEVLIIFVSIFVTMVLCALLWEFVLGPDLESFGHARREWQRSRRIEQEEAITMDLEEQK